MTATTPAATEAPAAPAAAAAAPGAAERDLDSHLASLDRLPLFMRSLPKEGAEASARGAEVQRGDRDADADRSARTALEALQSLAHEGTPDEVAANFKEHGNEYFVGKRYREASQFYTQALDAKPTDAKLREAVLVNRAACNLELQNYGSTLRDTAAALELNPDNVKAHYRASRALLALSRPDEALDCCERALRVDATNDAVRSVRRTVVQRRDEAAKRQAESSERARRQKELKTALDAALLSRGFWVEVTPRPPDNPNPPHFDPESLPAVSRLDGVPLVGDGDASAAAARRWRAPDPIRTPLVLPVLFVYPQHSQSDLVSRFHEDASLEAHLDEMFPEGAGGGAAPAVAWDAAREYASRRLNVYATTRRGRTLKLGKRLSLRELADQAATDAPTPTAPSSPSPPTAAAAAGAGAASSRERDGLVLRDGVLTLVVLPAGSEAEREWIAQVKRQRAEAKR